MENFGSALLQPLRTLCVYGGLRRARSVCVSLSAFSFTVEVFVVLAENFDGLLQFVDLSLEFVRLAGLCAALLLPALGLRLLLRHALLPLLDRLVELSLTLLHLSVGRLSLKLNEGTSLSNCNSKASAASFRLCRPIPSYAVRILNLCNDDNNKNKHLF